MHFCNNATEDFRCLFGRSQSNFSYHICFAFSGSLSMFGLLLFGLIFFTHNWRKIFPRSHQDSICELIKCKALPSKESEVHIDRGHFQGVCQSETNGSHSLNALSVTRRDVECSCLCEKVLLFSVSGVLNS